MEKIKRVFLIVLDSFGIGAEPDCADFGDDETCNTFKSIYNSKNFSVPNLQRLGLFNIDGIDFGNAVNKPSASFARLRELSRGKDTTIGHWEIGGIVSEKPLPTYPNGFPADVMDELSKVLNRKLLCNKPYSGTKVIHDYGQEHEETGALIIYTSADSVLQIAAHEEIVSVEQLYNYCRIARKIMTGNHNVGRIIARPFIGKYPNYERTPRRHDFSLEPPQDTILDVLSRENFDVIGVGKIFDIFAGRGITRSLGINENNADGMNKTLKVMDEDFNGLCFVNLVDFDMVYGHRRDVDGYAQAMMDFDIQLGKFITKMKDDDILMITADHGCDPSAKGTDHTREYVPLLIYGSKIKSVNLGTYPTFATIAATIADIFNVKLSTKGESFLNLCKNF